jgi:hypothetical protein
LDGDYHIPGSSHTSPLPFPAFVFAFAFAFAATTTPHSPSSSSVAEKKVNMDLDPSPSSAPGDGGDAWPFDTSLLFSTSPPSSSSWLAPPSPFWLFDDRQLQTPAAPVVDDVQRARSGNPSSVPCLVCLHPFLFHGLPKDSLAISCVLIFD